MVSVSGLIMKTSAIISPSPSTVETLEALLSSSSRLAIVSNIAVLSGLFAAKHSSQARSGSVSFPPSIIVMLSLSLIKHRLTIVLFKLSPSKVPFNP